MSFRDPETERKRLVQAERRRKYPWIQWYRSRRWREARKRYLDLNPWCSLCPATPATVVDHIRPHRGDERLFWDASNWRPLCKRCHDAHTARSGGGFGNKEGDAPVPGCDESGLPLVKRPHWG